MNKPVTEFVYPFKEILPFGHVEGTVVDNKTVAKSYILIEDQGCKGYRADYGSWGYDYDCEYEFAGEINCEDCIFGPYGGTKDPRISTWEEE